MPSVVFVVPGDLDTRTGGYAYDRHIIEGLRDADWTVDVVALADGFPWPDAAALADAAERIAGLPDGCLVVADGLAFGVLPEIVARHAQRLAWVALVHHPLALETGLDEAQRRQLFDSEWRALAMARRVIVTSQATAHALQRDYGVPPARIHVVAPGTAPARPHEHPAGDSLSLLCVATVTPRKGYGVLIDALAGLQDRAWTLHCVGSLARSPGTACALRGAIAAHGLVQRVHLHGEVQADRLAAHYAQADAFVLPSFHEGYGMALAEALAQGLPIVSTTAGAIPDTVPAGAGVLVPPGDAQALRAALARLLDDPAWRASLARGARAVGARLPGWREAAARFAEALRLP